MVVRSIGMWQRRRRTWGEGLGGDVLTVMIDRGKMQIVECNHTIICYITPLENDTLASGNQ